MPNDHQKMNFTYSAYLYGRNAKGVFIKGYDNSVNEPGPYILFAFIHTLSLPLTLTFLAGFKTILDIITRHPLQAKDMDSLKDKIEKCGDEDFEAAVTQILQYQKKVKSNSSRELVRALEQTTDRPSRQKLILDYLNEWKNLGKKLQQIINSAFTEERSLRCTPK